MSTIEVIGSNDSGADSLVSINDNFAALNADKAELASPAFTGTPTAPTPTALDSSTKIATTAFVMGEKRGYTITLGLTSTSPTDSTTYYGGPYVGFGSITTDGQARGYIPKAGKIKSVHVFFNNFGTLGSAETMVMSLRLNGTSDTTLNGTFATNSTPQAFNVTGLAIDVVAGDYISLKLPTPAWATNPTSLQLMAIVYIE